MSTGLRGRDPRGWPVSDPAQVLDFFRGRPEHVVYFAGYGELGYDDPALVARVVEAVLGRWPPGGVLAHIGTLIRVDGEDGIAEAFRVARRLGVTTTGVHPSVVNEFHTTHRVAPECDHVFLVADDTWGGRTTAGVDSPTLRLHLAVSHEMVAIGGGRYAAQELRAFVAAGKPVRYVPAAMNRDAARRWCRRTGIADLDPAGEAAVVWAELRGVAAAGQPGSTSEQASSAARQASRCAGSTPRSRPSRPCSPGWSGGG